MFEWNTKKITVGALAVVLLFAAGCCVYFYQPENKTAEIYKSALEDFEKGDYQNSYYLFSKISLFSNLKPVAIFHRAECAKMLGDAKSEIKQYEILFNNYPKHKLSLKAKYLTAQKLVKDKPELAKRYFEQIIEYAPNTDYALASEYYRGLILKNKYKSQNIPQTVRKEIENSFRHYISQAPSGRLAFNAVNNWLELNNNISSDDYILMANTCYLFGEYEKAKELLKSTNPSDNWALNAKVSYALHDYNAVKTNVENGIQTASDKISQDDVIEAIDTYIKSNGSSDKLIATANKGKDYLTYQKCKKLSSNEQLGCYNKLYLDYPTGRFSADALSNIFFSKIKSGDLQNAIKIGKDHLNKFPNTKTSPMVMFWLGKIYERQNNYTEFTNYYKATIEKYPDSYYAYRAYLRLKRIQGPIIHTNIKPQPIEYPYNYSKNNIIVKLVNLGDYNIINEFAGDDGFIKSWVQYKKGDWSSSVITARDAMDKLTDKPDKYDLRWRLVYPVMYYDYVKKYSDETGNNLPLMIALIREESHFDPLAQSSVGASGLMQLMPLTANEINSKYELNLNISQALFNPEKNIKLGSYYYEFLRKNLEGQDVSSVAAYNGGIGSLKTWKTNLRYNDTDEFIEQIPYEETKNYVKKVYKSYWNYVRLYTE